MNTLTHAAEAYAEGRLTVASQLADRCLRQAALRGDRHLEGRALQQLAQVHIASGRTAVGLRDAQRAASVFEALNDGVAHTQTLLTVAYAASHLRDNELALFAGARALQVSTQIGSPILQSAASNYYGVSLLWMNEHAAADAVLRDAIRLARHGRSKVAEVLAMRNRVSSCIYHMQLDRIFERESSDATALTAALAELNSLDPSGSTFMHAASYLDGEASSACLNGLTASWGGDLAMARECLEHCSGLLQSDAARRTRRGLHIMQPYFALTRYEYARALGDWPEAIRCANEVAMAAQRTQNYQTAWLGQALKLHAYESLGLYNDAARGWRMLLRSEHERQPRNHPETSAPASDRSLPGLAVRHRTASKPAGDGVLVRARPHAPRAPDDWQSRYELTASEFAVLGLVAQGLRPGRIAALRGTSVGTVRSQLHRIFEKTGLDSQQSLIAALAQASGSPSV